MKKLNTKKRGPTIADDYLELIRRFPLRPIRGESEYGQAVALLEELVGRADVGQTEGERDYTDALSHFVRAFDEAHFPSAKTLNTPMARLKYLMEQHGMDTAAIGDLLGNGKSQASSILLGKRELSKANIVALANFFKVSAAAFI